MTSLHSVHVRAAPLPRARIFISMAKSIRSKRRQRVLAVRREKYKIVERKKCWDHQLKRQLDKKEEMDVQKLEGEY